MSKAKVGRVVLKQRLGKLTTRSRRRRRANKPNQKEKNNQKNQQQLYCFAIRFALAISSTTIVNAEIGLQRLLRISILYRNILPVDLCEDIMPDLSFM